MFKHGFPPEWSTLKKLIWLVGSGIAGAAAGIWKTVTGSLIHITDALASPMQKCEVTLEPIQDLHGQDAPYPAGGGKNKGYLSADNIYSNQRNENTYANNGVIVTGTGQYGRCGFSMPVVNGETYTISGKAKYTGEAVVRLGFSDENDWYNHYGVVNLTTTLAPFSKTITATGDTLYVEVYPGNVDRSITIEDFQVEKGSSATTFAPYSNICPITGWTGCEVQQTGVNFCSVSGTGEFERTKTVNISPLPPGIYYMSAVVHSNDVDANTCAIAFYNTATGQYVSPNRSLNRSVSDERSSLAFSITDVCDRLIFYASSSYPTSAGDTADFSDIQISLLDEETYHAYSGTTLSVTFPDSTGTVYGGTVDLVSGELVVDRAVYTFDGTESGWIRSSSFNGSFYRNTGVFHKQISDKNICSHAEYLPSFSTGYQYGYWGLDGGGKANINVFIQQPNTTVEEFKTYLAEQYANGTPLQFVVELETPIEIQLTPQEISTLRGENNVWSNGDFVEITYKAQA